MLRKNISEQFNKVIFYACALIVLLLTGSGHIFSQADTVSITVNVLKVCGPMKPFWAYFGYDEPNYTYMKNGKKLLTEISNLSPVPVFVRTHNLLTSGDGTPALKWGSTNAYTEDSTGMPVYNWTITDSIFDTYIERGMKPLVEIGFMPEALSVNPKPYRHSWNIDQPYNNIYTGWTYPPEDYSKWAELVYRWVKHCIDRYGEEEVKTWLWETWNEPNISYWSGTCEEYCKLYDYTVDAVKRACPECIVGGPHTTGPGWDKAYDYLTRFLLHCLNGRNHATGEKGSPLEFIAFHAKGRPEIVDNYVRMNMGTQLNDIARGFEAVSSFPELKGIPIIIGECDPEGCAACSEKTNPQNGYRNGTMYSSYTASSFAKIYELMDKYEVNLQGVLSWSFEFEDQDWFGGFRSLATNGVDKPVLNVFRMFGMMEGNRVETKSENAVAAGEVIEMGVRGTLPDINALAAKGDNSLGIMVWNYHDDDLPAEESLIDLKIEGIPEEKIILHHYRIDTEFSNSFETWKKMGRPQKVNHEQYKQLEDAGQLQLLTSSEWLETENGSTCIKFSLPRQGVSFLQLTW
jgi:xylan 1,4-beta-xylosidase